jgi:rhodanese-related sulfurtransferase
MEDHIVPAIAPAWQSRFSTVLEFPAADPADAYQHFANKFAYETDVADLMADLKNHNQDIVVIGTRSAKAFSECHIPGALHLPKVTPEATAQLAKDKVYIVYCWGPACNGATKRAMQLSQLGYRVKELLGGIEYWRSEGGEVDGSLGTTAPLFWSVGA